LQEPNTETLHWLWAGTKSRNSCAWVDMEQ